MKEKFRKRKIEVYLERGFDSAEFYDVESNDYCFTFHSNDEFTEYNKQGNWTEEKWNKARREISKMTECIQNIHNLYFDKDNDDY